jgi:formamidopyrimidine-DNA glycosylase
VPELPDILLYLHALHPRIVGRRLERVRLTSPFLLRSIAPPLEIAHGRRVVALHRLGKRIVMELEGDLFLVFHLMIAGRFRWRAAVEGKTERPKPGKIGLALDFDNGTLLLTEAGTTRRASLYVVQGRERLAEHDRGGLEVLDADADAFAEVLRRENHTLKRALTDPRLFSGIGNAYSDEILHAARLSPFKMTQALTDTEIERLHDATRRTLTGWVDRLRAETGDDFPEKGTAFREGMAVHGRYGQPCPDCGSPVQRIVYAANEAPTTAPRARPPDGCSPTARSRGCCGRIGRGRWRRWRRGDREQETGDRRQNVPGPSLDERPSRIERRCQVHTARPDTPRPCPCGATTKSTKHTKDTTFGTS